MNDGHWFCSFCDDIKFLPAPAADSKNDVERCLDCKNNSLYWIPAKDKRPMSPERAAILFHQMKEAVK